MLHAWMAFVKYLLVAFGVFYEICGNTLLIKGAIELEAYSKYSHFNFGQHYPVNFIIIGFAMILIGFFGGYGALKESQRVILMFLILTAASDLMIVIHGIFTNFSLLSTHIHNFEMNVRKELNEGLQSHSKYRDDWDNLQRSFNCCGIGHPGDWNSIYNNSSLPWSCCSSNSLNNSSCLMRNETTGFHQTGCLPVLTEHIWNDFNILVGIIWSKMILTLLTIISLSYVAVMDKGYARLIKI